MFYISCELPAHCSPETQSEATVNVEKITVGRRIRADQVRYRSDVLMSPRRITQERTQTRAADWPKEFPPGEMGRPN
jgi:hypothetical protein